MNLSPGIRQESAVALVVTLAVVAMLTISIVAFLSSVSLDLRTSNAYLAKVRAEYALNAALTEAETRLLFLIQEHPHHAIGYEEALDPEGNTTILPVLDASESYGGQPTTHYLISGGSTNPPDLNLPSTVDLNIKKASNDTAGWIGSPVSNDGIQVHRPVYAQWINMLQDPTLPAQPDPNLPDHNPIIARFAYTIEDESSKLDIRHVGNMEGPQLGDGALFARSDLSESVTDLDIGALPLKVADERLLPLAFDNEGASINQSLLEFRSNSDTQPLLIDPLWPGAAADLPDLAKIQFHFTQHSLSNELAGTGRRRANLNAIVTPSNLPEIIAADLNDLIWVITGSHYFRESHSLDPTTSIALYLEEPELPSDDVEPPLPDFGSRYYPGVTSTSNEALLKDNHQRTYLVRLAANIRDLIDPDVAATFVDYAGDVLDPSTVQAAWLEGEEPVALGKEFAPLLQEHAFYARELAYQEVSGNTRRITFSLDHYLELYNPHTRDWTAPVDTMIKLMNRPIFAAGSFADFQPPDISIDISNVTFPAGETIIITTAPSQADDHPDFSIQTTSVVRCQSDDSNAPLHLPATSRIFSNLMCDSQCSVDGNSGRGLRLDGRSSSNADYHTEFVFLSPDGLIEANCYISWPGSGFTRVMNFNGTKVNNTSYYMLSTTPRGNTENTGKGRTGEMRGMSEAFRITRGSNSAYGKDQSRWFDGPDTLGDAQIEYIDPNAWPDYHPSLDNTSATAYAVFPNNQLTSIGQLGYLYDPAKLFSTDSNLTPNILTARGGGRTLRIGQIDDLVPQTRFSTEPPEAFAPVSNSSQTEWRNGAWHLTDLFGVDSPSEPVLDPTAPAKININGVLRDNGIAFRAALRDFQFLPSPDGGIERSAGGEGLPLDDAEIDLLVEDVLDYLRGENAYTGLNTGRFLTRGEIGQLRFFTSPDQLAGGVSGEFVMDRSREEILRRTIALITTRSCSFEVHCVAQSVEQLPNGTIQPTATTRERYTLHLLPQFDESTPKEKPGATSTAFISQRVTKGP